MPTPGRVVPRDIPNSRRVWICGAATPRLDSRNRLRGLCGKVGSQVTPQARASKAAVCQISCSIPLAAFKVAERKLAPLTPRAAVTVTRLVHTLAVPPLFAIARYSSPAVAAAMTTTIGQNRRRIVLISSPALRAIDCPARTHASSLIWPPTSAWPASSPCHADAWVRSAPVTDTDVVGTDAEVAGVVHPSLTAAALTSAQSCQFCSDRLTVAAENGGSASVASASHVCKVAS